MGQRLNEKAQGVRKLNFWTGPCKLTMGWRLDRVSGAEQLLLRIFFLCLAPFLPAAVPPSSPTQRRFPPQPSTWRCLKLLRLPGQVVHSSSTPPRSRAPTRAPAASAQPHGRLPNASSSVRRPYPAPPRASSFTFFLRNTLQTHSHPIYACRNIKTTYNLKHYIRSARTAHVTSAEQKQIPTWYVASYCLPAGVLWPQ